MAVRKPTILWAQRDDKVFLTVDVKGAKDLDIRIEEDKKFSFKCKDMDDGDFAFDLEFFAKVKADTLIQRTKRLAEICVDKQESEEWDKLHTGPKMPNLKIDWDKYDDGEGDAKEFDTEGMGGMGGMPGMGGMGGMPGMGGMGGMPGMGGMGGMPGMEQMMSSMGDGMGGMPGMEGMGGMDFSKLGLGGMGGMGGGDDDDEDDSDDELPDLDEPVNEGDEDGAAAGGEKLIEEVAPKGTAEPPIAAPDEQVGA